MKKEINSNESDKITPDRDISSSKNTKVSEEGASIMSTMFGGLLGFWGGLEFGGIGTALIGGIIGAVLVNMTASAFTWQVDNGIK